MKRPRWPTVVLVLICLLAIALLIAFAERRRALRKHQELLGKTTRRLHALMQSKYLSTEHRKACDGRVERALGLAGKDEVPAEPLLHGAILVYGGVTPEDGLLGIEWLEKVEQQEQTAVAGFCVEVVGDNASRVYQVPWPVAQIAYICRYGYSWEGTAPILFGAGDNVSYRPMRFSPGTVLITGEDVLKHEIYVWVYDSAGKKSNKLRAVLYDPYEDLADERPEELPRDAGKR